MAYPRRGEIWLVRFANQPWDQKDRPALVVSLDVRNRLANDIILVPLSTTLRSAPTHVELPAGEGGIEQASMAKCEQIATLDKSLLLRGPFAGRIRPGLMHEVEKAILRAIGIATD